VRGLGGHRRAFVHRRMGVLVLLAGALSTAMVSPGEPGVPPAVAQPSPCGPPSPTTAGPQLNQCPGLDQLPSLGGVPGAPEVQGVTNSGASTTTGEAAAEIGRFVGPFQPAPESTQPSCPFESEGAATSATEGPPDGRTTADIVCKPAAVNVAVLPDGRILYWDGLEAEENIDWNEVAEVGDKAADDQSRVMSLGIGPEGLYQPAGTTATVPTPSDGGARSTPDYLVPHAPGPLAGVLNDPGNAPGDLFCTDQVQLYDGELLVPGGTQWYEEPKVPGTPYGVAELQGLENTRLFDPSTDTWTQSGPMNYGRWYPSLVTLPDGNVFVASGVTKLIKPVYSDDPLVSGTNVEQTEVYDVRSGRWAANPPSADHPLPLYPRLHLLPDGHVYYDAGGQVFNPDGQSYDEAVWNLAASYDPATQSWAVLGVPFGVSTEPGRPLDTSISAGFRGSSFSVMLPLVPDASGSYRQAQFLSAGGVLGTTPGGYFATASSIVDTVTIGPGDTESFSSTPTGPLHNARWFSTGVLLPTGQVMAFSGANRDEVLGPGTGFAVRQAELFDPTTSSWTPMASGIDERTYHNTAVLLPTGQVLVGGNAPINTLYGYSQTLPGGFSNGFRDPSFELYDPPYLNWGIAQPVITGVSGVPGDPVGMGYGGQLQVSVHLPSQATGVATVALVRNPSLTHLVDGDQRQVDLPFAVTSSSPSGALTLRARLPADGAVLPPGPYMLFVDAETAKGLIPSIAAQLSVLPAAAGAPHGTVLVDSVPATAPDALPALLRAATAPAAASALPSSRSDGSTPAGSRPPADHAALADRQGRPPTAPWVPLAVLAAGGSTLAVVLRRHRRPAARRRAPPG
jgi:hypothetical protein